MLKDNHRIEFPIYNTTQEADINAKKADLLKYLRTQLKNSQIDLDLVIDKSKEPQGVYTDADKYKKLVEKNPKIEELRKKFGLNF